MWNHIVKQPDMFVFRHTPTRRWLPGTYGYIAGGFATLALLMATVAAWITHVVVCIKASAWILLAFGCIVVPVGVVHGIGVWLGMF